MGQVTMNTDLGKYIYRTCLSENNISTVVDVGTWDGRGTTECAIRGLRDSGREGISLLSFETNKEFYNLAVSSWNLEGLPSWAKLIHGRLVDESELDRDHLTGDEPNWLADDVSWYSSTPKVADMLPQKIDLAILDGGEFSTKAEFLLLEPITKMFILDDTATRKCRWIRNHVLSNPSKYEVIFDLQNDRNGTMAFAKSN
jgi:hypothetical protein